MAISQVDTGVYAQSPNGGTTSAFNSTGATLLVASTSTQDPAIVALSDSKGNTWSCITSQTEGFLTVQLWWTGGPSLSVGSGHTVTISDPWGNGASAFVTAWKGTETSSTTCEAGTGYHIGGGTSIQPGAITPSKDGTLLITNYGNPSGGTDSVDSGFTSFGDWGTYTGLLTTAYLIQGTKATINPTWWDNAGGNKRAGAMASFKPGAPSGSVFLPTLLAGLGAGGPFFRNPIG